LVPEIKAVVSRGGRTDLVEDSMVQFRAPTLLIAGGQDHPVLECNKMTLGPLDCLKEMKIVPGATHLFQEPHALERVVGFATSWFGRHRAKDSLPLASGPGFLTNAA
jgi:putative phosphoribosyl transferase